MVNFNNWLREELNKRNLLQKELAGMMNVSQGIVIAKVFNLPEKEVLLVGGYDEQYGSFSNSSVVTNSSGSATVSYYPPDVKEVTSVILKVEFQGTTGLTASTVTIPGTIELAFQ